MSARMLIAAHETQARTIVYATAGAIGSALLAYTALVLLSIRGAQGPRGAFEAAYSPDIGFIWHVGANNCLILAGIYVSASIAVRRGGVAGRVLSAIAAITLAGAWVVRAAADAAALGAGHDPLGFVAETAPHTIAELSVIVAPAIWAAVSGRPLRPAALCALAAALWICALAEALI